MFQRLLDVDMLDNLDSEQVAIVPKQEHALLAFQNW